MQPVASSNQNDFKAEASQAGAPEAEGVMQQGPALNAQAAAQEVCGARVKQKPAPKAAEATRNVKKATSQQGPAPKAAAMAPLGLMDMPALWLEQLPQALCSQGQKCSQLYKSCKYFRELLFTQRSLNLGFTLPMQPATWPAAGAELARACQLSSRVKIMLSSSRREGRPSHIQWQMAMIDACGFDLMTKAVGAIPGGLTSIRSVDLTGLILNCLVPSWLTFTCLNMTSLRVTNCQFIVPETSTAIPVCPQLKELTFKNVPEPNDQSKWQHQFKALTGLTSLTLGEGATSYVLPWAFHIRKQLTHLSVWTLTKGWLLPAEPPEPAVPGDPAPPVQQEALPLERVPRLPTWFPNLTSLQLPNTRPHQFIVQDVNMRPLLSLKHLTWLECCGFKLTLDYSGLPCPWKHLGFAHLDIASFDRLALKGIKSFRKAGAGDRLCVYPSAVVEVNRRVLATIAAAGGLEWESKAVTDMQVVLENEDALLDGAGLADLLPFVASCKPRQFALDYARPVTPELLGAMSVHLSHTVRSMQFSNCSLSAEVLPLLLPSLPPAIRKLDLDYCESFTEGDLREMCVHACRPITIALRVEDVSSGGDWWPGWKGRVREAMLGEGHRHVILLDKERGDGVESEEEWESGLEGRSAGGGKGEAGKGRGGKGGERRPRLCPGLGVDPALGGKLRCKARRCKPSSSVEVVTLSDDMDGLEVLGREQEGKGRKTESMGGEEREVVVISDSE